MTLRYAAADQSSAAAGDRPRRPAPGSAKDAGGRRRPPQLDGQLKLGELQAQMLRLGRVGRPSGEAGRAQAPGMAAHVATRSGTRPRRPGADRCAATSQSMNSAPSLARRFRARSSSAPISWACCEALSGDRLGEAEVPADRYRPIEDGWFSSNFGWRIDPFSGQKSFHRRHRFSVEVRDRDRCGRRWQGYLRGRASGLW